jgi:hypothetical protein
MADSANTIHWLNESGAIETFTEFLDENGNVYAHSGMKPPDGTWLSVDDLINIFTNDTLEMRKRHARDQEIAERQFNLSISQNKMRRQILIESGMDLAAVDVLCPQLEGEFVPCEFHPASGAYEALMSYGLNQQQVEQVLSAEAPRES